MGAGLFSAGSWGPLGHPGPRSAHHNNGPARTKRWGSIYGHIRFGAEGVQGAKAAGGGLQLGVWGKRRGPPGRWVRSDSTPNSLAPLATVLVSFSRTPSARPPRQKSRRAAAPAAANAEAPGRRRRRRQVAAPERLFGQKVGGAGRPPRAAGPGMAAGGPCGPRRRPGRGRRGGRERVPRHQGGGDAGAGVGGRGRERQQGRVDGRRGAHPPDRRRGRPLRLLGRPAGRGPGAPPPPGPPRGWREPGWRRWRRRRRWRGAPG